MYRASLPYPKVIRIRWLLIIRLVAVLILASLAFVAGLTLGISSSTTPDGYEADPISLVRNSVIPVPTPPAVEIRSLPTQISTPSYVGLVEPIIVPVPVQTPPL